MIGRVRNKVLLMHILTDTTQKSPSELIKCGQTSLNVGNMLNVGPSNRFLFSSGVLIYSFKNKTCHFLKGLHESCLPWFKWASNALGNQGIMYPAAPFEVILAPVQTIYHPPPSPRLVLTLMSESWRAPFVSSCVAKVIPRLESIGGAELSCSRAAKGTNSFSIDFTKGRQYGKEPATFPHSWALLVKVVMVGWCWGWGVRQPLYQYMSGRLWCNPPLIIWPQVPVLPTHVSMCPWARHWKWYFPTLIIWWCKLLWFD